MKKTKDDIEKNNNVCLVVWDAEEVGYKLIGTAEYFASGKWKEFVESLPENEEFPAKGAILITISKVIKSAGV